MVVYNIHNLVHLPEDVKQHGPLDAFSAFPFENFLGRLKRLVRKRTCILQQVVLRLSEISQLPVICKPADVVPLLRKNHIQGPLLNVNAYQPCSQYKELVLKNFVITTRRGDNCVKIGEKVCLVQNILQCEHGVVLVYKAFLSDRPFYTYPLDSRLLDIHKVSNICDDLHVADISQILMKYVLLPYQHKYVAFPMLHISH